MWPFLRALLGTWTVRVLLLVAFISAAGVFLPGVKSPGWFPLAILIVALLIASWNIYADKEPTTRARRSADDNGAVSLVIRQSGPSRYFNCITAEGQPVGLYFELHVVVENPGKKVSAISSYDLEIGETGKSYKHIRPKALNAVRTRKGIYSLTGTKMLAPAIPVRVSAGSVLGPGILAFYLEDVLPEPLPSIHCILGLRDADGREVTCSIELPEA